MRIRRPLFFFYKANGHFASLYLDYVRVIELSLAARADLRRKETEKFQ